MKAKILLLATVYLIFSIVQPILKTLSFGVGLVIPCISRLRFPSGSELKNNANAKFLFQFDLVMLLDVHALTVIDMGNILTRQSSFIGLSLIFIPKQTMSVYCRCAVYNLFTLAVLISSK